MRMSFFLQHCRDVLHFCFDWLQRTRAPLMNTGTPVTNIEFIKLIPAESCHLCAKHNFVAGIIRPSFHLSSVSLSAIPVGRLFPVEVHPWRSE